MDVFVKIGTISLDLNESLRYPKGRNSKMALNLKTNLEEQLLKIRREAEEKDAQKKAQAAGLSYLNLSAAPVQVDALKTVKEEEARRLLVAPFQLKEKEVALAVSNPGAPGVQELIKRLEKQGLKAKLFVVSSGSLAHVWSF